MTACSQLDRQEQRWMYPLPKQQNWGKPSMFQGEQAVVNRHLLDHAFSTTWASVLKHSHHPGAWETEAGGLQTLEQATQWGPSPAAQHRETLSPEQVCLSCLPLPWFNDATPNNSSRKVTHNEEKISVQMWSSPLWHTRRATHKADGNGSNTVSPCAAVKLTNAMCHGESSSI